MADIKHYTLREGNKDTDHVFTGGSPRRAALKAATRGFKDIQLREHGKKKDGMWRGLGKIALSKLALHTDHVEHDAHLRFENR